MYLARFLLILALLIAIVGLSTLDAHSQVTSSWQNVQPGFVQFMDHLYMVVRSMIAGDGSDDQMDVEPGAPDVDFDRVVTMDLRLSS